MSEAADLPDRDALVRFCAGLIGDMHKAEDIAQESLARYLNTDPKPKAARAWLFATARNLCVDAQRAHGVARMEPLPPSAELPKEISRALSRIVRVERDSLVSEALRALPSNFREALLLRYSEGLSRAEIGQVLDLEPDQVRWQLAEGKRRFEEHLNRLRVSRPGS